jgi:hypothetical protein
VVNLPPEIINEIADAACGIRIPSFDAPESESDNSLTGDTQHLGVSDGVAVKQSDVNEVNNIVGKSLSIGIGSEYRLNEKRSLLSVKEQIDLDKRKSRLISSTPASCLKKTCGKTFGQKSTNRCFEITTPQLQYWMDLQNTMSDPEIDKFASEFFTIDTGGKFRYNLLTRSTEATEVNVEIPVCRKMFMAAFGMNPRVGGKPWAVLGKDRMKRLEDLKRKSVGELIIRSDKKVAKMGKHDARQHQHFNDEHNLNKLEGLKEFSRIGLK